MPSPGSRCGRCWCRRAWRTRRWSACRSSTGSTRRSQRCCVSRVRHVEAPRRGPERERRGGLGRRRRAAGRRRGHGNRRGGRLHGRARAGDGRASTWRSALLRMGWVSTFLSKAVMAGFILGFSIGIIIDQSPSCSASPSTTAPTCRSSGRTIKELPDTNAATLAVGAGSLVAAAADALRAAELAARADHHGARDPRRGGLRPREPRRGGHRARPDRSVLGRAARTSAGARRRAARRRALGRSSSATRSRSPQPGRWRTSTDTRSIPTRS